MSLRRLVLPALCLLLALPRPAAAEEEDALFGIRLYKTQLKAVGCYDGPIDPKRDARYVEAMKCAQVKFRLADERTADGRYSEQLITLLEMAAKDATASTGRDEGLNTRVGQMLVVDPEVCKGAFLVDLSRSSARVVHIYRQDGPAPDPLCDETAGYFANLRFPAAKLYAVHRVKGGGDLRRGLASATPAGISWWRNPTIRAANGTLAGYLRGEAPNGRKQAYGGAERFAALSPMSASGQVPGMEMVSELFRKDALSWARRNVKAPAPGASSAACRRNVQSRMLLCTRDGFTDVATCGGVRWNRTRCGAQEGWRHQYTGRRFDSPHDAAEALCR